MGSPALSISPLTLSKDQALAIAEMFRLMGDPSRLKIVVACLDAPRCVSDIAEALDLSPSLVSHHLRLLRAARMLGAERRGKQVFYAAKDDHVRSVIADMIAHAHEPDDDDHG